MKNVAIIAFKTLLITFFIKSSSSSSFPIGVGRRKDRNTFIPNACQREILFTGMIVTMISFHPYWMMNAATMAPNIAQIKTPNTFIANPPL